MAPGNGTKRTRSNRMSWPKIWGSFRHHRRTPPNQQPIEFTAVSCVASKYTNRHMWKWFNENDQKTTLVVMAWIWLNPSHEHHRFKMHRHSQQKRNTMKPILAPFIDDYIGIQICTARITQSLHDLKSLVVWMKMFSYLIYVNFVSLQQHQRKKERRKQSRVNCIWKNSLSFRAHHSKMHK